MPVWMQVGFAVIAVVGPAVIALFKMQLKMLKKQARMEQFFTPGSDVAQAAGGTVMELLKKVDEDVKLLRTNCIAHLRTDVKEIQRWRATQEGD